MNIQDYKKIAIVGSPGSGKSWLSKKIAALTGYPLHHLDVEFWKPGWEGENARSRMDCASTRAYQRRTVDY
ncbi:MAG: hypothetical protein FWE06_01620 [Oscillospiraceae bacterium]|nr:hypothetical protein [Oscillospiraceae bacterium]